MSVADGGFILRRLLGMPEGTRLKCQLSPYQAVAGPEEGVYQVRDGGTRAVAPLEQEYFLVSA